MRTSLRGGGCDLDKTGEVATINLDAIAIFYQKPYSSITLKYGGKYFLFFSDSILVSKCCDLMQKPCLLELVNLRVGDNQKIVTRREMMGSKKEKFPQVI